MATVGSQDNSALVDQTIPQWKRELILRKRALARTLPAGNATVKLTRPSVVASVRFPDQTAVDNVTSKSQQCNTPGTSPIASSKGGLDQESGDFNPRGRCESCQPSVTAATAAAPASVAGNMRLVEHVADAAADLMTNGVCVETSVITTETNSLKQCAKMGEETSLKKMCTIGRTDVDNSALLSENNNGHGQDECQSDSSEELEYGPGIVNKLRSKYLSMTLRESQGKGMRPSLVSLRRATSLENMLESEDLDTGKPQIKTQQRFVKKEEANKTITKPQKPSQHHQRYRAITRGNDSMKRARSVEALYRNELKSNKVVVKPKVNAIDINRNSAPVIKPLVNEDIVIVESKLKPPRKPPLGENKNLQGQKMRATSIAPETELPPPDVVKQTKKIFEGSPPQKVPSYPVKGGNVAVKSAVKPAVPPKLNIEKLHQKALNRPPPRTTSTQSPPPTKLLSTTDNSITNTFLPLPLSPTPGIRKVKSPSPTIESKQALILGIKENSENDHQPFFPSSLTNGRTTSKVQPAEEEDSDEDIGDGSVRPVASSVLENIRKDGLSLQFAFNKAENNTNNKIKNYLPLNKSNISKEQPPPLSPLLSPTIFAEAPSVKIVPSSPLQTSPRQVGVIRPMITNKNQSTCVAGREMQNNIINREKSNDQPKPKNVLKSPTIDSASVKENTKNSEKPVLPSTLRSTKSGDQPQNIMVFNFTTRNDPPPDYIADDGLNLAPKHKMGAGDRGVLILDQPGESSTDESAALLLGPPSPPSPCLITFEGANVLINGRSNLRKHGEATRASKLRISFDDAATTTFEYPSEASLLEPNTPGVGEQEDGASGGASHQPPPLSMTLAAPAAPTPGVPVPLGGSSLASYTPSKVHLGSEDFQLGVTRAAPAVTPALNSTSDAAIRADMEEEEDEDYLKPAEESETVAWSAETTADLLF